MSLILRGNKGSKLTTSELDGNFEYLESISGAGGGSPSGTVTIEGSYITTLDLSSLTTIGIFTALSEH